MVTAVCRNEPIVFALHVGNKYMYTENKPYSVAGFDRGAGNHAVAADDAIMPKGGFSNITDVAIDQFGSWGTSHGDQGRVLIQPRHIEEPSKYHCFYAVRSAVTGPDDKCPTLRA